MKIITITKYKTKKNNLKWLLRLFGKMKIFSYSKTTDEIVNFIMEVKRNIGTSLKIYFNFGSRLLA